MTPFERNLDWIVLALATVLGTGSIALFAISGMRHLLPLGFSDSTALLWDAALSLFFFLQHSGMVRRSFRAHLTRVLPDRYQVAFYAITSGIALTLVAILWQPTQRRLFVFTGPARWVITAAALSTLAIFVWTARTAESFDLLGLRPIRAHLKGRGARPSHFVARGPYSWVRHPLYSCVLVLLWCTPVLTADRLLLNVLWSAWVCLGAALEERDLIADFGDVYRDYRQRVPMLIPWRGHVRLDAQ